MGVAGKSQPAGLGQIKVSAFRSPPIRHLDKVMNASPGNSRAPGMAEIRSSGGFYVAAKAGGFCSPDLLLRSVYCSAKHKQRAFESEREGARRHPQAAR